METLSAEAPIEAIRMSTDMGITLGGTAATAASSAIAMAQGVVEGVQSASADFASAAILPFVSKAFMPRPKHLPRSRICEPRTQVPARQGRTTSAPECLRWRLEGTG